MATSKKQPETATRLVWRMSAGMPQGEYVEVAPPATRPGDGGPETHRRRSTDSGALVPPGLGDTGLRRRHEDAAADTASTPRMLRPPHAENWQASSFDLLEGCRTRDVTDTIPDNVFDELFGEHADEQVPRAAKDAG